MAKKKETRGGARPGAGRPSQDKVSITVTVDRALADHVAALVEEVNEKKSIIVNTALWQFVENMLEVLEIEGGIGRFPWRR